MRQSALMISSALLIGIMPAPSALADWQYAKWGMAPAEVMSASGGKAVEKVERGGASGKDRKRIVSEYSTGPFAFDVLFEFNVRTSRLAGVSLTLRDTGREDGECGDLNGALFNRYGAATFESKGQGFDIQVWQLRSSNTAVGLTRVLSSKGLCKLRYSALLNDHNEGL